MEFPTAPEDLRALDEVFARRVNQRINIARWVAQQWPAPAPEGDAADPQTSL